LTCAPGAMKAPRAATTRTRSECASIRCSWRSPASDARRGGWLDWANENTCTRFTETSTSAVGGAGRRAERRRKEEDDLDAEGNALDGCAFGGETPRDLTAVGADVEQIDASQTCTALAAALRRLGPVPRRG
jgi:hypothetical protein